MLREMKALQECEDSHHVSQSVSCLAAMRVRPCLILQVVRLRDVFPHGPGFVLVFDYMLSDLAEVVRNSERPLTEVSSLSQLLNISATEILYYQGQIKSYMIQLLKGVTYLHSHSIMHRVSS